MCMTPAFRAIVEESERRHMPTSYVRDLYYHDRNYLESEQPPCFGWMLRDMGTHMFDPRYRGLEWLEAAIKVYPDGLLYWWNGSHLEPVSATELRVLLTVHGSGE